MTSRPYTPGDHPGSDDLLSVENVCNHLPDWLQWFMPNAISKQNFTEADLIEATEAHEYFAGEVNPRMSITKINAAAERKLLPIEEGPVCVINFDDNRLEFLKPLVLATLFLVSIATRGQIPDDTEEAIDTLATTCSSFQSLGTLGSLSEYTLRWFDTDAGSACPPADADTGASVAAGSVDDIKATPLTCFDHMVAEREEHGQKKASSTPDYKTP